MRGGADPIRNRSGPAAGGWLLIALLLLPPLSGFAAQPPPLAAERAAMLRRGINLTGWFRHPASRDPAALRAWMGDPAMADLRAAGLTFVRLAFDPAVLEDPAVRAVLLEQTVRLQRHGLAVVLSPHPVNWRIDENPADQARFAAFWRGFAPALRALPPGLTFPEILNEPVFHARPEDWTRLRRDLLATIRAALPAHTVILTGHDWDSIAALVSRPPEGDANVVHSFHFYDPPELTSLAAYRPGLDRAALARLPFPATGSSPSCEAAAASAADAATRDLMRFYCALQWDAARVAAPLDRAAAWAKRHNAVLVAGEFGASVALNPAARLAWLRLVRETCAAHGIGWALWGYDDVMGLAVPRPPGRRPALDRSTLAALGLGASARIGISATTPE